MPADGLQPDKTFVVSMKTWFDQTDGLGILHHSHYVLLMERAQKTFFVATMGKDTLDPAIAPDVYVVVRNLELSYLVPIRPECTVKLQTSNSAAKTATPSSPRLRGPSAVWTASRTSPPRGRTSSGRGMRRCYGKSSEYGVPITE
ncbi:MAG: hypothetical protein RL492_1517 [Verrucomicrobiota bacterium]